MTMSGHSRSANASASLQRKGAQIFAAALLLALFGPFGTALTMKLGVRTAYWLVTVSIIGGSIFALRWVLDRRLFGGRAPAWFIVLIALLAALPGALVVQACLARWSPSALAHVGIPALALQVLLVNLTAAGIELALRRRHQAAAPSTVGASSDEPTPFMARLPKHLQKAKLLAVEAQDHYVQVHTDAGCALIHMRISDAEALLSASEGFRAHRSFWVARAAVERVERRAGREFLHLTGGLCVPVGRARRGMLQEAGWL